MLMALVRILKALVDILQAIRFSNRQPGLVWFKVIREENSMLVGKIKLPSPGAGDVVTRQLSYQVNGGEPVSLELGGSATETEEISVEDNSVITGTLVDVDDAGNSSEARSFEFTVTDTIAPPQPGEVGFEVVREE